MSRFFKYLFFTSFLFFALPLFAQQNNDMLKQFLKVENGLSHNEVTSIVQDNDGFIWIGTRGGLNRYDGYEFKVFNQEPGEENSLVNPSIEKLFIDSKGNIWIGTKSGGVSKYNPETGQFKNLVNNYQKADEVVPLNRVLSFYEDKQERMWIGAWTKGLYIYDEEKQEAKQYLTGTRVSSIVGTADGRIFVGATKTGGLFEYDSEKDSFIQHSDIRCRQILYDEPRNVLWIVGGDNVGAGSSKKGLTRLDLRNNKISNFGMGAADNGASKLPHSYYSLHLDEKGKIWVGTWGTGLYVFDPENDNFERRYIYPEGSGSRNRDYDAILDIYEDKNNNVWLGTNGGGICILSDKLGFNSVGYSNERQKGLKNSRVMSVLEDRSGNLWIGTIGNGLFWSPDRERYYQVNYPAGMNKNRFFVIKNIFEDSNGRVWFGSNIGTYLVEFVGDKPQLVKYAEKYNVPELSAIFVSFLDYDGMIWMGSLTNGLFFIDKETSRLKKQLSVGSYYLGNMRSNRISCIKKDSRDRIWLGTYNGLHVFHKADTTIRIAEEYYDFTGTFTGNIVTCIDEDQNGNIWVGTPNGLNRVSQKGKNSFEVQQFTEKDGLASNFIKGIACDLKGNIWFSTNMGISKFHVAHKRFINFNETDGILGRNFTEASVFKNSKGELFFGGTHGLTYFNPDDIIEHKLALKPVFTDLNVLNQPVEVGEEYDSKTILDKSIAQTEKIELSYEQNKLEIQFSALDFISHGTNNYEYLLENSDEHWNNIGNRRFVIFSDLPAGEYNLKVRSSNRHNIWSEEIAQLKIVIKPPLWRTWYALLFYILVAITIITIIRWNAVKQVRLANSLELEKLQHEQDQKMSEMKLRFFTNISHEFRTPLTLILAPIKDIFSKKEDYNLDAEIENKLGVIQNNSLRLMRMVNQLIDFRKVESGNAKLWASYTNIVDFVEEVCYPFRELAQINDIRFNVKSSLKTKEIWFDRDKMEIVLNNLISNAFKFVSTGGKVEVALFEEEEEVLLSVSDNGQGIPSTELKHIFERFYQIENKDNLGSSGIGLALSKRFVELNKGSITVASEQGVNTEFVVSLPKGKKHLKPEEIVESEKRTSGLVKHDRIPGNLLAAKDKTKVQTGVRILIVDDTSEVRNYLVDLLSQYYSTEIAENGKEALAKVKQLKPNLIISDVMMPEMDGFEFCKKLRSKEQYATIPFIFLTAKSDEQFRLLGTQAGANDYISKPFDPTLLLEKVKNILERHSKLQKQYSRSVRLEPSDVEITSGEEIFIKNIIEVIEKNLHNSQFSSEVLAAEMNRSYSSLYRKLKKLTGLSAAEFIRSIRIKRAGQLLADREKTISEIAYDVGFNDIKHFRTVFQKHFGCSPSKYREKL